MKKPIKSEPDIMALLTGIQEQIAALDKKVEVLIGRGVALPVEARPVLRPIVPSPVVAPAPVPAKVPVSAPVKPPALPSSKERPLYPAVCADCSKDCELPFKPTGDRPVYCKECFHRRKTGGAGKIMPENGPRAVPPEEAVVLASAPIPKLAMPEKKKPVVVSKPSVNKPAANKSLPKKKAAPRRK